MKSKLVVCVVLFLIITACTVILFETNTNRVTLVETRAWFESVGMHGRIHFSAVSNDESKVFYVTDMCGGYYEMKNGLKWDYIRHASLISYMFYGDKPAQPMLLKLLRNDTGLLNDIAFYGGGENGLNISMPPGRYRWVLYYTDDYDYAAEMIAAHPYYKPGVEYDMTRCYRVTAEFTIPER